MPWEPRANTGRAMHPGDVIAPARFVEVGDDCIAGPLPLAPIVAQPHLHSDETRVEIWGVADAARG